MSSLRMVQKDVHKLANEKGWWEGKDISCIPEKLALIHSEISECLEEYRNGHPLDEVYYPTATSGYIDPDSGQFCDWGPDNTPEWKPEGFGIELADALIRILDLAEFLDIDMEDLIQLKYQYNRTRSYRHDGKLA